MDSIWWFKCEADPERSLSIKYTSARHPFTVSFEYFSNHRAAAPLQEAGSEETTTGWLHYCPLTTASNTTSLVLLTEKQPLHSTESLQV